MNTRDLLLFDKQEDHRERSPVAEQAELQRFVKPAQVRPFYFLYLPLGLYLFEWYLDRLNCL